MAYDPNAPAGPAYPPPPPPQAESRRKGGCFRWIGIATVAFLALIVLIVVVALAGGGDDDDDTSTDTTQEREAAEESGTSAAPSEGQDVYAVGDTAHTADLDVTVHTVQDPYQPTNEFETPQQGNRFVAVEAELTNSTDEPITWSSIAGAELTDEQNRPYTVALAGTDLPQLDGDVPARGARRGWVAFEVPEDATGLQLRIKGSLTAEGSLFGLGGG
jgi:hypothetical protein